MKTNRPAFRIGCLILAAWRLAISPSFAQTQEPAGATAAATVISSVAVTQASQRAACASKARDHSRFAPRACRIRNAWCSTFAVPACQVHKTIDSRRFGSGARRAARPVSPRRCARRGRSDVCCSISDFAGRRRGGRFLRRAAGIARRSRSTRRDKERRVRSFTMLRPARAPRRARSAKRLQISAPRFALPGELTQPSVVLASFSGKDEPARPEGRAGSGAAGDPAGRQCRRDHR